MQMARNSFVFYISFYDAIKDMENEEFAKCIRAMCEYAFNEKESDLDAASKLFLTMAKPQIDASNNRYDKCVENGMKGKKYGKLGGRPKKENPRENPNENPREEPQTKPLNYNYKSNVNVNYKHSQLDKEKNSEEITYAGTVCTSGCNLPAGMTQEEYERRMREARE